MRNKLYCFLTSRPQIRVHPKVMRVVSDRDSREEAYRIVIQEISDR